MTWQDVVHILLPTAIVAVIFQFSWTLLCRTFPSLIGDAILSKLNHENSVALERLRSASAKESALEIEHAKADLNAAYSTIKNSIDFISISRSGIQEKVIGSVDVLWYLTLQVKEALSDIVFVHMILTPEELAAAISGQERIEAIEELYKYADDKILLAKLSPLQSIDVERHRLFVGDRLWLLYFLIRAIHFRLGHLMQKSLKERRFVHWRQDDGMISLIRSALPAYRIEPDKPGLDDFQQIVSHLDAEFLKEAARVMSGSHAFAESLADVQASLLYETAKIASKR